MSMTTPIPTSPTSSPTESIIFVPGPKWDPKIFTIVILVPLLPLLELLVAYLWVRRRKFGKYIHYPHMSHRQRMKRRSYGDDYEYDDEETYTRKPWRPTQSQGTDETLTRRASTSSTYAYAYGSSAKARYHGATSSMGSTSTTSHYVTPSAVNHHRPTSTSPRSSLHYQPPSSPSTPTPSIIQPRQRDSSLPSAYKQSVQTTSISESSRATSPSTPISPASSSKHQMVIPIISVSSHDDEDEGGAAQPGAVVLDFGSDDDEQEAGEGEYYGHNDEEGVVDMMHFRGADVLSDIEEEGSLPSSVSTIPSFAPITELSHPQALYHRVQRIEPWTP